MEARTGQQYTATRHGINAQYRCPNIYNKCVHGINTIVQTILILIFLLNPAAFDW